MWYVALLLILLCLTSSGFSNIFSTQTRKLLIRPVMSESRQMRKDTKLSILGQMRSLRTQTLSWRVNQRKIRPRLLILHRCNPQLLSSFRPNRQGKRKLKSVFWCRASDLMKPLELYTAEVIGHVFLCSSTKKAQGWGFGPPVSAWMSLIRRQLYTELPGLS